jgi:hypothetical protein
MTDETHHTQNPAPQNQGQRNGQQAQSQPRNEQPITDHTSKPGQPSYGQMASQYGPNYNPYLFGGPSPQQMGPNPQAAPQGQPNPNGNGQSAPQGQFGYGPYQGMPPYGGPAGPGPQGPQGSQGQAPRGPQYGYGPWSPAPQNGMNNGNGQNPNPNQNPYGPYGQPPQNPYGYPSFGFVRINPDDPNQNPLYNHWDWISIVAFILSLSWTFVFLSLPMAFIGYNRCKNLHMRGKGLAIAAIVLSIVNVIGMIVVMLNPSLLSGYSGLLGSLGQAGAGAQSTVFQTVFM